MPYCPKCKSEYREGFAKCADCNVDLVEKLVESKEVDFDEMPDDIKLEHLVRANNHIEFGYITSTLEAEGIYWKNAGSIPASYFQSRRGFYPQSLIYLWIVLS